MASINYTAIDRGFLVSGHSASTSYDIDFSIDQLDESLNIMETTERSLSGYAESLYNRTDWMFTLQAVWLDADDVASFKEFITSCGAHETFSFDPTGTSGSPGSTIYSCTLDSYNLNPRRNAATLEANTKYSISLTFRVEGIL